MITNQWAGRRGGIQDPDHNKIELLTIYCIGLERLITGSLFLYPLNCSFLVTREKPAVSAIVCADRAAGHLIGSGIDSAYIKVCSWRWRT